MRGKPIRAVPAMPRLRLLFPEGIIFRVRGQQQIRDEILDL
jgi:hypothetical protein